MTRRMDLDKLEQVSIRARDVPWEINDECDQ